MSGWSGGLVEWIEGDTAFLSIAFTYRLREAYTRALWFRSLGYRVRAGGPGIFTRKTFLADVAEVGGSYPDAVARHNPLATFATRGCDVGCWWCIVPKMEGRTYTLDPDFPVRPVLCDNNLSGLPRKYQEHIVARYQAAGVWLQDANSGFAPDTFDDEVLARWAPINRGPWRFAFDEEKERPHVERVMGMLKHVSPKRKRVYVMVGNEPFENCLDRIRSVLSWGGEPHVQPYMKLNALEKKPNIRFDWNDQLLRDVARWANQRRWRYTDFAGYRRSLKSANRATVGQLLPEAA